jgi:FMN phosphatase YigB (HAD superfamily)
VGGTLGTVDTQLQLHLFPTTKGILQAMRTLGVRLGVISNVPDSMSVSGLKKLLEKAEILSHFEEGLIVASTEAGAQKPAAAIYRFAAGRAGVPIGECMYIGEAANEVEGAVASGMTAILKPV